MANTEKVLPYYTYSDYMRWEDRWELLEGIPYAKSPAPAPAHQKIISKLHYLFHDALAQKKCHQSIVYDFIDLKIKEDTIIQPDLLIVCGEIKNQYLDFPPALVVEVLSPSTALKDKNNKFIIYETFKVKYYVMIDPDKHMIEIYYTDANGKYQLVRENEKEEMDYMLDGDCKIKLALSKVWD